MSRKKIVITGDTGLLGANLCYLWRNEYDIVGVSRAARSIRDIKHIQADITDTENLGRIVQSEKPNVIVHTAAIASVEECEYNPQLAQVTNTDATAALSELAEGVGAYFVFISTDAFYQGVGNDSCSEDADVTPNSVYSRNKLDGERIVAQNLQAISLRTNFYGFNLLNKLSLGEWVLDGLEKNKTLTMFTDVLYSPILVNDLAGIIIQCFNNRIAGIYNAGATDSTTKYEFGKNVKEVFGITSGKISKGSVVNMNFAAWRSTNMSMDSSKLADELKIRPPTVAEGIAQFSKLFEGGYAQNLKSTLE